MLGIEYLYKRYQKFFVILGGFLLNFTIGNLYTYNNMAPEIVNYMKIYSKSNDTITDGNAVWIFGMGIFGMGSSITLGSFFVRRIGPSLTVLIAGWLMSITVLLMGYILNTYLAVVILTYGFINGIGSGIVYGVTIDTGCNWFPNRKGMAAGLIVAGFGFSAFVIDLAQYAIVGQQIKNVPFSYIVLGCVFILLQFIGAMLLRNPPTEEVSLSSEKFASDKFASDLLGLSEEKKESLDIKPHHIILELDFWILWLTYSLLSACFALIISLHKQYGIILHMTKHSGFLTWASSVGSLCNALGRILWGLVIDRVRYKVVMLLLTISLAILLGTFYMPVFINNSTNSTNSSSENPGEKAFYFIWIILLYLVPSGMFAIFPYMSAKLFGQKNFVANYGMLFSAYSLGGLVTSSITTSIWDGERSDNKRLFLWAFTSGSIMAVLAALLTLLYRGRSLLRSSRYL